MSRLLRFDVAGSVHHVTNRGIERRDIVRDDKDRQEFVRLLGRIAARHRWRVFAWVLMDNHFHLFFRREVASLSAGMHDLESGYASLFNRRHERDGALFQGDRQMKTYQYKPDAQASAFYRNADKACTRLRVGLVLAVQPVGSLLPLAQGRFHDVVVEQESHAWELTRYVHLNPCRARLVVRPEEWAWGSYRHDLNPRGAPSWLDWATVLAERSHNEAAARVAYKRFIDAGRDQPLASPWLAAVDDWILGSPAFVARVREVCLSDRALKPSACEEVIAAVAERYQVPAAVIRRRGRHDNAARLLAALLCRELLTLPAAEIATAFGLSASGFSTALKQARERWEHDANFAAHAHALREMWGRSETP
ncbi:MAG TPA: transposase [Planctomycetaceae bacterium]|nr:transposase [Planctomycetaceae bacterium]